MNKKIIIINITALFVIAGVIGYLVYDKYYSQPQGSRPMGEMNIEDICNQPDKEERQRPEGEMPEGTEGKGNREGFNKEGMEERQALIQEICEDGEVSEEEKQRFEELSN